MKIIVASIVALLLSYAFKALFGEDYPLLVVGILIAGCIMEWTRTLLDFSFWLIMFLALGAFAGSALWWVMFAMMLFYIAAENGVIKFEKGE